MKKSVKVLAGITAFVLIGGILWFANSLVGNPVSKALSNNTAKKYVSKNYSDMELQISDVYYSFKDGYYHADIKSLTSKDTYFSIRLSSLGKVEYDSYEYNVVKKFNTYRRLDEEYNSKLKNIFEDKAFPYGSDISFGELKGMPLEDLDSKYSEFGPVYGINLDELELDKNYDINEMGKEYGHIVFYAQDEDISIKRASEILLDIKNILDKNNISFYAIDFTLEKHGEEDEKVNTNEKSIIIEEFLYEDIYEEGLENRMKKASDKLQEHYKEQDKIKKEEMESIDKRENESERKL